MCSSIVSIPTKSFSEPGITIKAFNYSILFLNCLFLHTLKNVGMHFKYLIAAGESERSLGIIYSDCSIFISQATSAEKHWGKTGERESIFNWHFTWTFYSGFKLWCLIIDWGRGVGVSSFCSTVFWVIWIEEEHTVRFAEGINLGKERVKIRWQFGL